MSEYDTGCRCHPCVTSAAMKRRKADERDLLAADYALQDATREAKFYREQLKLICQDKRKTRARLLAESALIFWDAMKAEVAKRRITATKI